MIFKYLIFVIFIVSGSLILTFFYKPMTIGDIRAGAVSDVYAKILWKELNKQDDFEARFKIIQKILEYSPDYRKAYDDLCSMYQDYMASSASKDEILDILKNGTRKFDEDKYTQCYVNSLKSLELYDEAIEFLKSGHKNIKDPYRSAWYIELINKFIFEKNVIFLTKAVEKYFQQTKTYPGDISVLVEKGIIDEIPEDPYGGQYFIYKQGQIRSTSERGKKGV